MSLKATNENLPPTVIRQLAKELKNLDDSPPEGIKVIVNDEDFTTIFADIEGPGKILSDTLLCTFYHFVLCSNKLCAYADHALVLAYSCTYSFLSSCHVLFGANFFYEACRFWLFA
jgi:hypothetical protein